MVTQLLKIECFQVSKKLNPHDYLQSSCHLTWIW
jgi:hypothetical protein